MAQVIVTVSRTDGSSRNFALLSLAAAVARAQTCGSAPTVALSSLVAVDGTLTVQWAPYTNAPDLAGFSVQVSALAAAPDGPSFGACSAPRSVSRLVAPDVTSATFLGLVAQATYSVSIAPVLGASTATAAPCAASASTPATFSPARAALPTYDAPAVWLDAESFPTMGGPAAGAQQLLTGQVPDATGKWFFKLYGSTLATTKISLMARAPMRGAKALYFSGATDFLVPNVTNSVQAGPTDNSAFGWATDADNTITLVAAHQSLPTRDGGFVVSKGAYPYFADSGWNMASYEHSPHYPPTPPANLT
jgi:hypothetical protein